MEFHIRELSLDDVEIINKWRNDKDILRFLTAPYRYISKETDLNWFDNYSKSKSNNIRLGICESLEGKLIGVVYLLNIDWIARKCDFGLMIGNKNFQGKGAGRYGINKAIDHAFNDLNLNKINILVLSCNKKAISLYESTGFIKEGVLNQEVFKNGNYLDLITMALFNNKT